MTREDDSLDPSETSTRTHGSSRQGKRWKRGQALQVGTGTPSVLLLLLPPAAESDNPESTSRVVERERQRQVQVLARAGPPLSLGLSSPFWTAGYKDPDCCLSRKQHVSSISPTPPTPPRLHPEYRGPCL